MKLKINVNQDVIVDLKFESNFPKFSDEWYQELNEAIEGRRQEIEKELIDNLDLYYDAEKVEVVY